MPTFAFCKDDQGRYWVYRTDGGVNVYVVNPTTNRNSILPALQAQFGTEINPTSVSNELNILDGTSTGAVQTQDGGPDIGTQVDTMTSDPNSTGTDGAGDSSS